MPNLPRWIWPVGLALIVLCGASFVLQCLEEIPTQSGWEKSVLIIGLTLGAVLVVWFWSGKWMRMRHDVVPGTSLLSRVSVRYRVLIGFGLLAFVALGIQGFRMSFNPALEESEGFVRGNDAVLTSFGPINDLTVDAMFWNVGTSPDGTSTGKYTFYLTGAKRSGIVQVFWQSAHGVYTAREIDELPQGDNGVQRTLWKAK